jgi:hypothetical protein
MSEQPTSTYQPPRHDDKSGGVTTGKGEFIDSVDALVEE